MSTVSAIPTRNRERATVGGEAAVCARRSLAAATELLDEASTEQAVTLWAVARRAGTTAPAICGHSAHREAILLAAVQEALSGPVAVDEHEGGRSRSWCGVRIWSRRCRTA